MTILKIAIEVKQGKKMEWLELPVYEEKIDELFDEVGSSSHDYFIADFEAEIPSVHLNGNEDIYELNNITEDIESMSEYELETYKAFANYLGGNFIEVYNEYENYDLTLYTDIKNDEELGLHVIKEMCPEYDDFLNNKTNLGYYFNYEDYGRDYRIETSGYFTDYGYLDLGY